jgi:arsenate reductase (thioredoxin)
VYKYLFICKENIGRSQMAEGFYNKNLSGKFSISAGIIDSSKKYNGHPRGDVIQVMREIGIDIHNQKVKQLTDKMLEMADKIVVLCDKEMCPLIVTKRANVVYINVYDPPDEAKTIEIVRKMRDKIKLIVENLE